MNEIRATQCVTTNAASSTASCAGDCINTQFPPLMDMVTEVLCPHCHCKKGFGQFPTLNAIGAKRSTTTSTSTSHEVLPDVNVLIVEKIRILRSTMRNYISKKIRSSLIAHVSMTKY